MVGLIGNPVADHKKWVRPEDPAAVPAPSYTITAKAPGSELAAESAAALASASLVFSWANMQEYAQLCLSHAVELYEFATKYKGSDTLINLVYHTRFTYLYIYSEEPYKAFITTRFHRFMIFIEVGKGTTTKLGGQQFGFLEQLSKKISSMMRVPFTNQVEKQTENLLTGTTRSE